MLIERKAERRCRCGFPHYTTLARELMFGNEPPKSPDALDRKPLARTAQEFFAFCVTIPATIIARACSPDERSDIRGGVRVVPDVALLIRATKVFPSLRAKRSNPSRRTTKAGLLRFARNDVESFEFQSAKRPHSRGTMPELCDSLSPMRATVPK
jgi:hypothetical protein